MPAAPHFSSFVKRRTKKLMKNQSLSVRTRSLFPLCPSALPTTFSVTLLSLPTVNGKIEINRPALQMALVSANRP